MKKKAAMAAVVVAIFLIGVVIWYNAPMDLMNADANEVMEIVIFNGNSGNTTHITDREQIQHLIAQWNTVEIKRSKPSVGYSGYSFKITIYLSDGNEADGWNNFVINSEGIIRKDPFFYAVTNGKLDYDYIENIVTSC